MLKESGNIPVERLLGFLNTREKLYEEVKFIIPTRSYRDEITHYKIIYRKSPLETTETVKLNGK